MRDEFNRDGHVLQYGYILQWPDGTLQVQSFRSNRHDCWYSQIGSERGRRNWKKAGLRWSSKENDSRGGRKMTTRERYIKETRETIKQARSWLDRLEGQLEMKNETEVISAFVVNQIAECATALTYRVGVINGTGLHESEVGN